MSLVLFCKCHWCCSANVTGAVLQHHWCCSANVTGAARQVSACNVRDGSATDAALMLADSSGSRVSSATVNSFHASRVFTALAHATTVHLFETTTVPWDAIWGNTAELQLLAVPQHALLFECSEQETTTLTCSDIPLLPPWAVSLVLCPSIALVLCALIYAVVLWRRWSVPGVGLVGCPICCACAWLSVKLLGKRQDVFNQENIAQERIETLEIQIMQAGGQEMPEWSPQMKLDSIDTEVVFFGYRLLHTLMTATDDCRP